MVANVSSTSIGCHMFLKDAPAFLSFIAGENNRVLFFWYLLLQCAELAATWTRDLVVYYSMAAIS